MDKPRLRASKNGFITLAVHPFHVPSEVVVESLPLTRQSGFVACPTIALCDVEADTLARMCDDFRHAVFAKAGKADPAK